MDSHTFGEGSQGALPFLEEDIVWEPHGVPELKLIDHQRPVLSVIDVPR
jgi:hypothetical protein